jgi:hypothetical protein
MVTGDVSRCVNSFQKVNVSPSEHLYIMGVGSMVDVSEAEWRAIDMQSLPIPQDRIQ